MSDSAPTSSETALVVRAVLGRLRRRLREVAAGDALSPSQASVLARLAKHDYEQATAASLAALEQVRPQSMAATLAALEQAGLIDRVPDPADGRRSLVALTAAGRGQDRGNSAARAEWFGRVLDERVSPEERGTIFEAMRILERMLDS